METISLTGTITKNGLILNEPELLFENINQKVKVVISPVEEPKTNVELIRILAKEFDEDVRSSIKEAISECRQIDYDGWK